MSWKPAAFDLVSFFMLDVSEARERLLAGLPVCGSERAPLSEAHQRVLAEDLIAEFDSPRFDNSSMDGFAVRSEDLRGASLERPARLAVVGDIPAGSITTYMVGKGEAMRIMTGAAMPGGADAVIPLEDTDINNAGTESPLTEAVGVLRELRQGDYVRPAGEDFRRGDVLIPAGKRLRAQELALLAMQGKQEVVAYKKPRVALFSSGDELLPVDAELAPGKIRETNSYALSALVKSCGAEVLWLGIAKDDLTDVVAHLDKAYEEKVNLIVTSAGVSVGAFDYLRAALEKNGKLQFWKVNMRPGKPFAFGEYRGIPYIGLPGNPASALVGFEVFVRPALQKMGGVRDWTHIFVSGELQEDVISDGRESYLRVRIVHDSGAWHVYLTGHQGSGNLYSFVQANALMRVPAGATRIKKNSQVELWLF
ncbi:MAG: molybdopterin molybdotransferase MoeA [Anaerolineales bacterium]